MRFQTRKRNRLDLWMLRQILGNRKRIAGVALQTQVQGLKPLKEEEAIEWRQRCADVTHPLKANFQHKGDASQRLREVGKDEAVIAGIRFRKAREPTGAKPVKLARIDNDTTNRVAVATDELGRRMDHDVRSVRDRVDDSRTCGCVVND